MKKLFLFSVLLIFLFIACNDEEFLDETPESFFTAENVFSSPTQVDQVVIALYSDLRNFMTTNVLMKGHGTDVLEAPQFRFGSNFSDYSNINSEHGNFYNIYSFYYRLIATANTAIEAAELPNMNWETQEFKDYTVGQARFFRAYAHGKLAQLFGGVPIVSEVIKAPKFDFERATTTETYQFAINELEEIVDDFPETTSQDGRLVRGAVYHFLAEFYLGLGVETEDNSAFESAVENASQVIDGGIFSLMTERFGARAEEADKNVYWDLFRINNINYNDGNNESIWTFQIDFDAFLAEDNESYLAYPRFYIPVYRAIPGVEGTAEDVGGRGVAFHAPTPYVINEVWQGDAHVPDIRNSEVNIGRTIYYNDPSNTDQFGQVVPQSEIDAANVNNGWIFPIFWKISTDQFVGLDQGENRSNLFRDDYVVRLAETILLRAEAYHRLGQNALAVDDINSIRLRSQALPIAANDVSIDFILDERTRELFLEESRWNTLLRMRGSVAVDRIREYSLHEIGRTSLNFDFDKWPIPQQVIDRNKDVVLEQNEGW